MGDIYLGTCGWSYKDWESVFYPKGEKNKLSYYARFFKTVEIDSTFYGYPSKGMIQGCARHTPDDFVFTAKLPKLITHDKRLDPEKGVKADLMRFLSLLRPLMDADKLGPLLIQLPPKFNYEDDLGRLEGFFGQLPADLKFAVEFRNKSWLRDETWALLTRYKVANTIVDEPLLPPDVRLTTSDFSYIRWHGRGQRPWYDYGYDASELESWVPKVREAAEKTSRVYGDFNNHFRGFAVENSLKMMELLNLAGAEQQALRRRVSDIIRSPDGPTPGEFQTEPY